jgi:hypothetical protein
MQRKANRAKNAIHFIDGIARHLRHPLLSRMSGDASHGDASSLEMQEKTGHNKSSIRAKSELRQSTWVKASSAIFRKSHSHSFFGAALTSTADSKRYGLLAKRELREQQRETD